MESGVYIQPLPVWESEWEHPGTHRNPYLLWNIEREGVLIDFRVPTKLPV